eukprot:s1246_g33.t1
MVKRQKNFSQEPSARAKKRRAILGEICAVPQEDLALCTVGFRDVHQHQGNFRDHSGSVASRVACNAEHRCVTLLLRGVLEAVAAEHPHGQHWKRGFHNPRFDEEAAAQQDREAAEEVIHFWCEELTTEDWFRQSHILDDRIRKEFGALHARAAAGELAGWAHEKDTCLALVIILDQFSRNLYRGSNSAYSCDAAARAAANMAIMRGDDKTWLPGPKRWALYLPFMHSDDLQDKARCVNLMREGTLGKNLRGAERHKEALPKLQASLSGSGHERKSKASPKASSSNVDKAHLTHQATPERGEDFALSDEESDFSDDEDVQIFKANTASHSRPRDGRKTYSMQAALEISSLPVLPLNHAHAQRFREMRLDAQMQQVDQSTISMAIFPAPAAIQAVGIGFIDWIS